MPLDCHLPPDSPLNRPDAFRRFTQESKNYLRQEHIEDQAKCWMSFDPLVLSRDRYNEIESTARKHSLMTQEEADALLTEVGTVWFISQAVGLDHFEASRLFLAGLPWPLRRQGDEGQWTAEMLSTK